MLDHMTEPVAHHVHDKWHHTFLFSHGLLAGIPLVSQFLNFPEISSVYSFSFWDTNVNKIWINLQKGKDFAVAAINRKPRRRGLSWSVACQPYARQKNNDCGALTCAACGNIVPIMFQVVLVQLWWSNKGHTKKIKSKTWGIKKNKVVNLWE